MAEHRCRDGRVLTWTGRGVCVCTECDEMFGSITAFDKHLKRKGQQGPARHDITGLVRNSAGHLVTKLRDASTVPG